MQIVVLTSILVAFTLVHPATREVLMPPGWQIAAGLCAYLGVAGMLGRLHTGLGLRSLGRLGSGAPRRRQALLSVVGQCWLIVGLGGLIYMGYGRWVMEALHLARVPLLGQLLVLVPFFVAVVLVWVVGYPLYRATRRRIALQEAAEGEPVSTGWSLGQYIAYNLRHHVLFIAVPVALIVLLTDSVTLYVAPRLDESIREPVKLGLMVAAAAGVFLFAPLLIVRIWRTEPLGDGPLKQDLERTCRQMGFRYRRLLVWKSGGMIANAGVMGLIAPLRYVLLSDALLERMSPRHVHAIFAHEAGHIVSKHILHAAMFAVASVLLCGAVGQTLAFEIGWSELATEGLVLAILAATWAFAFGWMSRRFERQSDVIAAWAASKEGAQQPCDVVTPEGAAVFVEALQRVGELNGIPPTQRNWRHGSIAHRVDYVLHLAGVGGSRRPIDRTVRRIKLALWLSLAAGVAVTVYQTVLYG